MARTDDLPAVLAEVLSGVMNAEANFLASSFEWTDATLRKQTFEKAMEQLIDARRKLRVLLDGAVADATPPPKGAA